MSKFLTPPVWYDKNGNLNEILTGDARWADNSVQNNIAIGFSSIAGGDRDLGGCTAIGYGAKADGYGSTVLGSQADADSESIAIGFGVSASGGGIGIGGNASANQVQLGKTTRAYNMTVGNGAGLINGVSLQNAFEINGTTVKLASGAKAISVHSDTADSNATNIISVTGLDIASKYILAVKWNSVSAGDTAAEYSSYVIINTAKSSGSIFYGSSCMFFANSSSVNLCSRYTADTPSGGEAGGKIDMVSLSSGSPTRYVGIGITAVYAIKLINT